MIKQLKKYFNFVNNYFSLFQKCCICKKEVMPWAMEEKITVASSINICMNFRDLKLKLNSFYSDKKIFLDHRKEISLVNCYAFLIYLCKVYNLQISSY